MLNVRNKRVFGRILSQNQCLPLATIIKKYGCEGFPHHIKDGDEADFLTRLLQRRQGD
jgi:hypothetical protein